MRILSHLTLGIALLTGTALLVPAEPVEAKKKKKKKKKNADPYAISLSAEAGPAYNGIAKALSENDYATAEAQLPAFEALAHTADDRYTVGNIRYTIGRLKKDYAVRLAGLNGMLASGKVPPDKLRAFNNEGGSLAYAIKDFPAAITKLTEARRLGDRSLGLLLNLAEANFKTETYAAGLVALNEAIAVQNSEKGTAPAQWYRRAIGISQKLKDKSQESEWWNRLVAAHPKPENWRNALYSYRNTTSLSSQENLDLMRLLRKTGAMVSQRDYGEYIDAADPRSLPGEVLAVINEGISTGVFQANDEYAKEVKDEVSGRVGDDRASLAASERDALKSADGKIAIATADAFLGYGDYAKASTLYKTAISKGGIDVNRANMRTAISMVGAGDLAAAKAKFATVTGKRAGISKLWTAWIDTQAKPKAVPVPSEPATPAS